MRLPGAGAGRIPGRFGEVVGCWAGGLGRIYVVPGVRSKAMLVRTCRRGSGAWVDGTYALTGFSDPCLGTNLGMPITFGC